MFKLKISKVKEILSKSYSYKLHLQLIVTITVIVQVTVKIDIIVKITKLVIVTVVNAIENKQLLQGN